jgi:hypothetical protein
MARTAVVAGTATVTAKAVGGAMDSRAAEQQQQEMAAMQSQQDMQQMQAQMQQMQAQLAQQPMQAQVPQQPMYAATPSAPATDITSKLQQLAQLKESGVLSDDEFQAAKAKLLAG